MRTLVLMYYAPWNGKILWLCEEDAVVAIADNWAHDLTNEPYPYDVEGFMAARPLNVPQSYYEWLPKQPALCGGSPAPELQPMITSISPTSTNMTAPVFWLTITGTNFTPDALVEISNATGSGVTVFTPEIFSDTEMRIQFEPGLGWQYGSRQVAVRQGDLVSNTQVLRVEFGPEPAPGSEPTITSVSPNPILNTESSTLTATGTNFTNSTKLVVDGQPWGGPGAGQDTGFMTPTQIRIPTFTTAAADGSQLSVQAVQGSVLSNAVTVDVLGVGPDPVPGSEPAITDISPSPVSLAGGEVTLTLTGTNFTDTTNIFAGGIILLMRSFVSPTEMTAVLRPDEFGQGTFSMLPRQGTVNGTALNLTITA